MEEESYPVYVANLCHKTTINELKSHFGKYGEILKIKFMCAPLYEMAMDVPPKVALIFYKNNEGMKLALKKDQQPFRSKRLHVLDPKTKHPVIPACTVLVGNLLRIVHEENLYKAFKQAGPIERVVKFVVDKALVIYKCSDSVEKALKIEKSFSGQQCTVNHFVGEMDKKVYYKESVDFVDKPKVGKKAVKRSSSGLPEPSPAKKIQEKYYYDPCSYGRNQVFAVKSKVFHNSLQQSPIIPQEPANIHPGNFKKLIELAFQAGKNVGEMNAQQQNYGRHQRYVVKPYADKSYSTGPNGSFEEPDHYPCYQTDNPINKFQ